MSDMVKVTFKLADGVDSPVMLVPVVPRVGEHVRLERTFGARIDATVIAVRHHADGFRGIGPLVFVELDAVAPGPA